MRMLTRILLFGWLLQPLYVLAEFAVAPGSREPYSFLDDTISALGITSCRAQPFPNACSSHHAWMNAAFIAFGVLLAAGAVGLRHCLPRTRMATITSVLWFVTGLGSIGVGLAPLDHSQGAHYAVALPIFVIRPVALALSAWALAQLHPRLSALTWIIAAITLVGVVGFGVAGAYGHLQGATERLALWPADFWFACVAITLLANARATRRGA